MVAKNIPKNVVVSGRITSSQKHVMDKQGWSVSDAISFFIQANKESAKSLEIQKNYVKSEIENLKIDLISKEMELEELESEKNNI